MSDFTTYKILGQKFIKFLRWFFGKLKTPKSHSEINSPLDSSGENSFNFFKHYFLRTFFHQERQWYSKDRSVCINLSFIREYIFFLYSVFNASFNKIVNTAQRNSTKIDFILFFSTNSFSLFSTFFVEC